MDDKQFLNKTVPTDEENKMIEKESGNLSRKYKNNYKEKKCTVIFYDRSRRILDLKFDGCGIRFRDIEQDIGEIVTVKYKGEIGKPNFECKL